MAPPDGKLMAFRAITAVVALTLSLGAAEVVLRLRHRSVASITGLPEWQTAQLHDLVYLWDQYHPRRGWTNLPGYRSDARVPFRVTINQQGLRGDRDYPVRAPAGTRRIAFFGDSLTFGDEVDDDETVPAFLDGQLRNVETLNFGVHGYGLGQMAMRLDDEGLALHPDHVVVMVMVPENLFRDLMREFVHAKPVFRISEGALLIENVPVPTASSLPWLQRRSFLAAYLFAHAAPEAEEPETARYLEVGGRLLRWIQTSAAAEQVPVTFVFTYNAAVLQHVGRNPVERERLAQARASLGLPGLDVLDLFPVLEEHLSSEGLALAMPSWHWSPRANCLIAREIATHLVRTQRGWASAPRPADCPPLRAGGDGR